MDTQLLATEDTTIQAADVLPAGTQPTSGFGLTTGKQVLLGFGMVIGGFAGLIVLAIIVMAIVYGVRGNLN